MEEALIELYLTGVSVQHIEDITEALWGVPRYFPPPSGSGTRKRMSILRIGATVLCRVGVIHSAM